MLRPIKIVALSTCIAAATLGLLCQDASAGFPITTFGTGSNSASASSWIGGAQFGYSRQQGSVVYGFETDISATDLKTDFNTVIPAAPGPAPLPITTANTNSKVDWYGTSRAILGWANGPVMFFGTAGVAYGHVELNSSISNTLLSLVSETSAVKVGGVFGGGIRYMVDPNLFLSLEYQHVDLGSVSLSSSTGGSGAGSALLSQNASANAKFDVVSLALNWRFYPTNGSPQAPWEGAYAGGHAGGAWGLNTSGDYFAQTTSFSDIALKRDVTLVARRPDGLGLYRYRYIWSDAVYVGVIAQEVALIHPDAIVRNALDNYLRVDYGRLGLRLMTETEWEARRAGKSL
jgi:outer membrane immunogenic protein